MAIADPYAEPNPWIERGFLALIFVATTFGVGAALLVNRPMDEGWFRFAPAGAMAVVSVVSIVQMRFLVLPGFISRSQTGQTQSYAQIATAMYALSGAFSSSMAMYGAVSAVLTDTWWIPLAFAAAALLAHSLFFSQARTELETLRRDMQTGATT